MTRIIEITNVYGDNHAKAKPTFHKVPENIEDLKKLINFKAIDRISSETNKSFYDEPTNQLTDENLQTLLDEGLLLHKPPMHAPGRLHAISIKADTIENFISKYQAKADAQIKNLEGKISPNHAEHNLIVQVDDTYNTHNNNIPWDDTRPSYLIAKDSDLNWEVSDYLSQKMTDYYQHEISDPFSTKEFIGYSENITRAFDKIFVDSMRNNKTNTVILPFYSNQYDVSWGDTNAITITVDTYETYTERVQNTLSDVLNKIKTAEIEAQKENTKSLSDKDLLNKLDQAMSNVKTSSTKDISPDF